MIIYVLFGGWISKLTLFSQCHLVLHLFVFCKFLEHVRQKHVVFGVERVSHQV